MKSIYIENKKLYLDQSFIEKRLVPFLISEEKRLKLEVAKLTLYMDAVDRNDFTNISPELLVEMKIVDNELKIRYEAEQELKFMDRIEL